MPDSEDEEPESGSEELQEDGSVEDGSNAKDIENASQGDENAEENAGSDEREEADAVGAQDMAGNDVNTSSFTEMRLESSLVEAAQDAWRLFIDGSSSREAAGEAIYSALFEGAPSLQSLFVTPRAVQAMRFMNGLNGFVMSLDDPPALKTSVETLGFGHLNLDVTVPRVVIFRDAILDLFQVELGDRLTTAAYTGWKALLNYVGGAIIYIKANYAERLRLLDESWKLATVSEKHDDVAALASADSGRGAVHKTEAKDSKKRSSVFGSKKEKASTAEGEAEEQGSSRNLRDNANTMMQNVPTTFPQMFQFNAAVMGFGANMWFAEVLACFDNIVRNVANSARLQEECDILVLRISRVASGKVNLSEYKSCMLASLRSLLPKDWSTDHEVAWCWLWENVERLLLKTMGRPPQWEKVLGKFLASLDEAQAFEFRAAIYAKFFSLAPAGQDFFKQSNTYLHLIAVKIMEMTIDIYREPVRMSDDISALGLRHVGYAIPTDLFGPFVSACIEVLGTVTTDEVLIESFRWSIGLIAKSLVRTILEGSTIVMKAINQNTKASLRKAMSCAPRGERASWMLVVQVGTQSISPLAWSIEAGSLEAASAILQDLTTFRADRDRYYYGADEMFKRHPDIVKKLCDNAPALLPELLDGLMWRSRLTVNGLRRVNYYVKHLLIDSEGGFAKTLEWVGKAKDPKIVCHPMLVLLTDRVWMGLASRAFLFRKSWFLLTLLIFILSQSVLANAKLLDQGPQQVVIFVCRLLIYMFSLGLQMLNQFPRIFKAYRKQETTRCFRFIPVPTYFLESWQDIISLLLMFLLMGMLCCEPILYCLAKDDGKDHDVFTEECDAASEIRKFPYSALSMLCMLLYYTLLADMTVFSTRLSAYVLACGRMLSEVFLFLIAMVATILTFACALSCLHQDIEKFQGIPEASVALWELTIGLTSEVDYHGLQDDVVILLACYLYLIITVIFLMNMLIAQLSCSYGSTYLDMVGFARLKRLQLIVDTMVGVSERRWDKFVSSLNLDRKLEFNEGDVGLPGGLQLLEPANANPTTVDQIQRFGGSTSPSMQWPDTDGANDDDADKFVRMEKLIQKTLTRISKGDTKRRRGGMSSSGSNVSRSGGDWGDGTGDGGSQGGSGASHASRADD